jgi:hypothetical protein
MKRRAMFVCREHQSTLAPDKEHAYFGEADASIDHLKLDDTHLIRLRHYLVGSINRDRSVNRALQGELWTSCQQMSAHASD